MKTNRRKRFLGIVLAAVMLASTMLSTSVFAAEEHDTLTENVVPRAGEETLPIGYYSIGSFTFRDTNLTPVKTVAGRYMQIMLGYSVASSDQGLGGIRLTVEVRDAYTGAVIGRYQGTVERGATAYASPTFDLGYAGRRIQFFFDASSSGASNGNYRTAYIQSFTAHVTN